MPKRVIRNAIRPFRPPKFPQRPSLRRWRKRRNLFSKELSLLIGHKNAAPYCRWEHGRATPSLLNALRLSAALRVPVEILFFEEFQLLRDEVNERGSRMKLRFHTGFEVIRKPVPIIKIRITPRRL